MEYQEIIATCVEENCEAPNKQFVISVEWQEHLAQQGWPLPKRCKDCREKKKNRVNSPFREVADQFKRGDYGQGKNKQNQNHRRHGRERRDFEGEENQ